MTPDITIGGDSGQVARVPVSPELITFRRVALKFEKDAANGRVLLRPDPQGRRATGRIERDPY